MNIIERLYKGPGTNKPDEESEMMSIEEFVMNGIEINGDEVKVDYSKFTLEERLFSLRIAPIIGIEIEIENEMNKNGQSADYIKGLETARKIVVDAKLRLIERMKTQQ
jgi:hypothetical protein